MLQSITWDGVKKFGYNTSLHLCCTRLGLVWITWNLKNLAQLCSTILQQQKLGLSRTLMFLTTELKQSTVQYCFRFSSSRLCNWEPHSVCHGCHCITLSARDTMYICTDSTSEAPFTIKPNCKPQRLSTTNSSQLHYTTMLLTVDAHTACTVSNWFILTTHGLYPSTKLKQLQNIVVLE